MGRPRILICGGRDFTDWDLLVKTMDDICWNRGWHYKPDEFGNSLPDVVVISGKARGADTLGEEWAILNWCEIDEYPAKWDEHGRSAGPIRNQQMLTEGKPNLVVAFPTKTSKGTYHMIKIARDAGVETIVIGPTSSI